MSENHINLTTSTSNVLIWAVNSFDLQINN